MTVKDDTNKTSVLYSKNAQGGYDKKRFKKVKTISVLPETYESTMYVEKLTGLVYVCFASLHICDSTDYVVLPNEEGNRKCFYRSEAMEHSFRTQCYGDGGVGLSGNYLLIARLRQSVSDALSLALGRFY
jgi:hypothetical protein